MTCRSTGLTCCLSLTREIYRIICLNNMKSSFLLTDYTDRRLSMRRLGARRIRHLPSARVYESMCPSWCNSLNTWWSASSNTLNKSVSTSQDCSSWVMSKSLRSSAWSRTSPNWRRICSRCSRESTDLSLFTKMTWPKAKLHKQVSLKHRWSARALLKFGELRTRDYSSKVWGRV